MASIQHVAAKGPARPPKTGGRTRCNGNPKDLDGNSHPWRTVEDGPRGTIYECPECGAVDSD